VLEKEQEWKRKASGGSALAPPPCRKLKLKEENVEDAREIN
jgi:hypothetical protein